ncbi:MAG: hypothetical protein ACK4FL_04095 [Microgenomates group bacterium]
MKNKTFLLLPADNEGEVIGQVVEVVKKICLTRFIIDKKYTILYI